ncbi:MAG: 30S ribosomal protein S12 methylthiotransferase RimO [Deltaproteobacteria bacterium HGW-Deltaproteobacteria-15]|nr:MAG: 30S ribosomal protein S12 methylthiotransferase RimO [Deltaproteobacteria bacterium HGW-Deltaproteobacteria-15]
MPQKSRSGEKVFLISLGCAKNRVDSEHMLGLLSCSGYTIAQKLEDADLAVINTCGFIQEAVEEAIGVILEVSREKKKGSLKKLYVAGCLVQRYGYKLAGELPEVDGWLGTGEIGRIREVMEGGASSFLIGPPGFLGDHKSPRIGAAPYYSAYIKIAEGCSHHCTYCTIPKIRGVFRSRPVESILCEAEDLAGRGVVEINLVAQDTTMYGSDLGKGNRLEDLLSALLRIEEIAWIRILYSHPERISEGLLDLLEQNERICPYLDIPLQHVNPQILKGMGRVNSRETPWHLVQRIRRRDRSIALRTSLIVGFPGETDEAFQELSDFVEQAVIDHLGVFVFSPEAGTPAARLGRRIEQEVMSERRERLMEIQSRISKRKNRALIGRILPVLVEGVSEETDLLLTGRTNTMAPEVDGKVYIRKGIGTVGRISRVLIREAHVYDLVGEIV